MKKACRRGLAALIGLAWGAGLNAADPNTAPVTFFPDGRLISLKAGGEELLREGKEPNRFSILHFDGRGVVAKLITRVTKQTEGWLLRGDADFPRLTVNFENRGYEVFVKLLRIEGVPIGKDTSLCLVLNSANPMQAQGEGVDIEAAGNALKLVWKFVGMPDALKTYGPVSLGTGPAPEAAGAVAKGARNPGPKPVSLEALSAGDPEAGFYLAVFNGKTVDSIPLDRSERDGTRLRLESTVKPGFSFEFELREHPKHLAVILKKAVGNFADHGAGLKYEYRSPKPFLVVPVDYMGVDGSGAGRLSLQWPYLWNPNQADPLGGFAVARGGDDQTNDAALAEIWASEESLPHPDIGRSWTEAEVRKWVDDFYAKFSGLSETCISASSPEELRFMTDATIKQGIRRLYLHTDTWRLEYMPMKYSLMEINRDVFPNGLADIRKYSEDIHARGMLLRLHNVSGGIGREDPEFVRKGDIDSRMESWLHGELVEPVSVEAREIKIKPRPGEAIPTVQLVPGYWSLKNVVIGREIVKVSDFLNTDGPIWTLKISQRGSDGSPAVAHEKGERVVGLMAAYNYNYVPDPATDLFDLIADRYALLINEGLLDHQHYDGAEIHQAMEEWGFRKFSYRVAQRLKRATTSSTSRGAPSPWNLELRFSRISRLKELSYWAIALPVGLESDRNAPNLLDAHFETAIRIANGARRMGLHRMGIGEYPKTKQPVFGVNKELYEAYGLTPDLGELVRRWQKVIFRLTDAEVAWMKTCLEAPPDAIKRAGILGQSRDVPILEERDGRFYLVPTRILCREGRDGPWVLGQEFGVFGPRQYLAPGEKVVMPNPYAAQTPGLMVRVLPALGPATATNAIQAARGNLWPSQVNQAGLTKAALEADRLILTAFNPGEQGYRNEEQFPSWPRQEPIEGQRALELAIDGDGSGAVLVVQLKGGGTRDYVVKIDFTGRRRVIIPNGEVSWTDAAWGWRFGTKNYNYTVPLNGVQVGFGYLPPQCNARVALEFIGLRPGVPSVLRDPVFDLGKGRLAVKGDIHSGEYLTYEAAQGVKVFDRNWKFLKALPSEAKNFIAGKLVSFQARSDGGGPQPWLELQMLCRGENYEVGKKGKE